MSKIKNLEYDLPDGWTCIGCGDEFLNDTTGKEIANYDVLMRYKKDQKERNDNL
mgnify:CR=1 FL=1